MVHSDVFILKQYYVGTVCHLLCLLRISTNYYYYYQYSGSEAVGGT